MKAYVSPRQQVKCPECGGCHDAETYNTAYGGYLSFLCVDTKRFSEETKKRAQAYACENARGVKQ